MFVPKRFGESLLFSTYPNFANLQLFNKHNRYPGVLDDVRIWSYPLEPIDVALDYLEFNPGQEICIEQDDPWRYYDVVGELGETSYCRIDLQDFAELALVWMECNIVPTCIP